jgi:hypothetical protein
MMDSSKRQDGIGGFRLFYCKTGIILAVLATIPNNFDANLNILLYNSVHRGTKYITGGIMTKAELVAKIAEGAELTKVQAEKALNCFIAVTTAALKADDKITLVGFSV